MSDNHYRFQLGEFECIAVSDGVSSSDVRKLFLNAPRQTLFEALEERGLPRDEIELSATCLLVNTGEQRILIDTGRGPTSESGGALVENLAAAGVKPDSIDAVILSHAHGDHIGGLTTKSGKLTFPKARYYMWRSEWSYWTSELTMIELPFAATRAAQKHLPPIADRVVLIDQEGEFLPGFEAISAPGHTIGHMALRISSDGKSLVYLGDSFLHPLHIEHPEWLALYDAFPEQAIASRRELLMMAAENDVMSAFYHFGFPSVGRVVQQERLSWHWELANGGSGAPEAEAEGPGTAKKP